MLTISGLRALHTHRNASAEHTSRIESKFRISNCCAHRTHCTLHCTLCTLAAAPSAAHTNRRAAIASKPLLAVHMARSARMALGLAIVAACCTGSAALAAATSKPWGGGQSASKPPRELLGRGAYSHFETIPTRWNDMDAQQHVWFSVSMRAIAAMAFRLTRLRRRPAPSTRRSLRTGQQRRLPFLYRRRHQPAPRPQRRGERREALHVREQLPVPAAALVADARRNRYESTARPRERGVPARALRRR